MHFWIPKYFHLETISPVNISLHLIQITEDEQVDSNENNEFYTFENKLPHFYRFLDLC